MYPLKLNPTTRLETNFNLSSLTIQLVDFKDIHTLLSCTTNLQYLDLRSEPPYLDITSSKILDLKLKKLSLSFHEKERHEMPNTYWFEKVDVNQLINFFKQFSSSLIYLSLDLIGCTLKDKNDFPFDEIKLQQCLEPLIKLKRFHLVASFFDNQRDENALQLTFNNQFWSDHNWSFGIYDDCLFTLPLHFDYPFMFCDIIKDVRIVTPHTLINNHRILESITTIELSTRTIGDFNFLKRLKTELPNLTTIRFSYMWSNCQNVLTESNRKEICLNTVTTIRFDFGQHDSMPEWVIEVSPNLKHLILGQAHFPAINDEYITILNKKIQYFDIFIAFTDIEFERLIQRCYIYFANIEYLYICASEWGGQVIEGKIFIEILKNFQNLKVLLADHIRPYSYNHFACSRENQCAEFDEINGIFEIMTFNTYILFSKKTYKF